MTGSRLLFNVVALAGGLLIGLVVGSAVVAGLATLAFAWLFTMLDDHPGRPW